LLTLEGHTDNVNSVVFSPDGQTLASGGEDRTIRLWNIATGELLRTFDKHTDWITTLVFSPDGRILVSGSLGGIIQIWGVEP
jgi:WD40 repeat protein